MLPDSSRAAPKDVGPEQPSPKLPQKRRFHPERSWELLGYLVPVYLSPFLYYGGKGPYLFTVFLPLSWWAVGTLPKAVAGFVPVVLLPLLCLEKEDQFVPLYYSREVLTAAALFSLALRSKFELGGLLTRLSLNVGLSFGLHVRWLFFSASLLAFLVALVLSEGPASVLFACLVDTVIRIWYGDTVRMLGLRGGTFGIRRISEARSWSVEQPIDQHSISETSKYHTSSEARPERLEAAGVAGQKEDSTKAGERQWDGASGSTGAGPMRHRVSISLSVDEPRRDSLVPNDVEMQRRNSDSSTKDDKQIRKRRPSVVFATAEESPLSPNDLKRQPTKPPAQSATDQHSQESKPTRRPSILKETSRFPEPAAPSASDHQLLELKPRRPSILKDTSRFYEAGLGRSTLPKVAGELNSAAFGVLVPFHLAQVTAAPSVPLADSSPCRPAKSHSLDSLFEEQACSMVLDKEVQERVYEALRRAFLMGPTLVIISVTSTSCFQYPAWMVLSTHLSVTPTTMWHWTLITFPSCVLSSAIGLLYVYVFVFKQYEHVLHPELQPRMLRFTARRLRSTPHARCNELLYMIFLTSYGCFYLLARIAGNDNEDAQLCVLCSMVIVTSAVTLEKRQEEKLGDSTDCWSRFPWHMVLLLGAVQVVSRVIEANNTLTASFPTSSWMQRSPLTVQIILAVVAALLSETMNSATLSRMLLPLTVHAAVSTRMHPIYYAIPVAVAASSNMIMPITLPLVVLHEVAEVPLRHLLFAGLVMKTALLSTLIISMNTTGQYIFHISPTVKGLNNTGPASRPQAPHY